MSEAAASPFDVGRANEAESRIVNLCDGKWARIQFKEAWPRTAYLVFDAEAGSTCQGISFYKMVEAQAGRASLYRPRNGSVFRSPAEMLALEGWTTLFRNNGLPGLTLEAELWSATVTTLEADLASTATSPPSIEWERVGSYTSQLEFGSLIRQMNQEEANQSAPGGNDPWLDTPCDCDTGSASGGGAFGQTPGGNGFVIGCECRRPIPDPEPDPCEDEDSDECDIMVCFLPCDPDDPDSCECPCDPDVEECLEDCPQTGYYVSTGPCCDDIAFVECEVECTSGVIPDGPPYPIWVCPGDVIPMIAGVGPDQDAPEPPCPDGMQCDCDPQYYCLNDVHLELQSVDCVEPGTPDAQLIGVPSLTCTLEQHYDELEFLVAFDIDSHAGTVEVVVDGESCLGKDCDEGDWTFHVMNVDLDAEGLSDDNEHVPPGVELCVNSDDDDGNEQPDLTQPGIVPGEDDLADLEVCFWPEDWPDPETMAPCTHPTWWLSYPGSVRVYDAATGAVIPSGQSRSIYHYPPPSELKLEGLSASSEPGDVTIVANMQIFPCDIISSCPAFEPTRIITDVVVATVRGPEIEFLETQAHTRLDGSTIDLVRVFNPQPTVVTYSVVEHTASNDPNGLATLSAVLESYVAPLAQDDVRFNDEPVPVLNLQSSGPDDQGPFRHSFLMTGVQIPRGDLLLKTEAVNALNNSVWAKHGWKTDFNVFGAFQSRTPLSLAAAPSGTVDMADYRFKIRVTDALAENDTLDVDLETGVANRTVTLERVGVGSPVFESDYLYLTPENLALPESTPQIIDDTRIPGRFGQHLTARYAVSADCEVEIEAVPVGGLYVDITDQQPVDRVNAGLPRDFGGSTLPDQRLQIRAGIPGESGVAVTVMVESTDHLDGGLDPARYQVPISLGRVGDDPEDDDFDLYVSDPTQAIFPIASNAEGAPAAPGTIQLAEVWSGGFLRATGAGGASFVDAVEPVRGEIFVNFPIDGLGTGLPAAAFPPGTSDLQFFLEHPTLLPNFKKLVGPPGTNVQNYGGFTTFPSITFSVWPSWSTGKFPNQHGITGSNFLRRDPAADPFSLPYWMAPPHDHVSYLGRGPLATDLDVAFVWAPGLSSLDQAMRPDVRTMYERVAETGLRSAVVWHMTWRGATYTQFPDTLDYLSTFVVGSVVGQDAAGLALDADVTKRLNELFAQAEWTPPQVMTVYYPGLDHAMHYDTLYPTSAQIYMSEFDYFLATLIRLLEQYNLMDRARFTTTGDHGLTKVVHNPITAITREDIEPVMAAIGLDVLDGPNAFADAEVAVGLNGGMAHVFVKNQTSEIWPDPPTFPQVVQVASRFYRNDTGAAVDNPTGFPATCLDLVLVRNASVPNGGWAAPYRVYTEVGGAPVFTPLAQAAIPNNYANFLNNIANLQDIRSGDVLLIPRYPFYFGEEFEAWHGHTVDTDMTIPLIFSFPKGQGPELTGFLTEAQNRVAANPTITVFARTLYKLLTGMELP
ncbi:MAG: hypothetical protein GY716_24665 [bacterium]|nr:hypothetical protein [bacterium]